MYHTCMYHNCQGSPQFFWYIPPKSANQQLIIRFCKSITSKVGCKVQLLYEHKQTWDQLYMYSTVYCPEQTSDMLDLHCNICTNLSKQTSMMYSTTCVLTREDLKPVGCTIQLVYYPEQPWDLCNKQYNLCTNLRRPETCWMYFSTPDSVSSNTESLEHKIHTGCSR